ncbi:MAG TPA: DUF1987 domain-containing protein [Bacteroidia bacterium]|jgi:hypothetical protein
MEALQITASEDTPAIVLDMVNGKFEVSQRSLPEDAATFYAPVLEWMMNYSKAPSEKTVFTFNLEYFNTSSAKQLFKLLNILEQISKEKTVSVLWCYDKGDQDMLASGERYARLTKLTFEMKENQ